MKTMLKVRASNEAVLKKYENEYDFCILFSSFEQFLNFNFPIRKNVIQIDLKINDGEKLDLNRLPSHLKIFLSLNQYDYDLFLDNTRNLSQKNIIINIPQSADFGVLAQFLASLGISSNIIFDNIKTLNMESVLDVFSYFQYIAKGNNSQVIIQPFNVLCNMNGFAGFNNSLYFAYQENYRNTFYIHDSGKVALSERLYAANLSFTGKDINAAITECKKFYSAQKHNVFLEKEKCAFCLYYQLCEGYLTTLDGYEKIGCEKFFELFELINKDCRGQVNKQPQPTCKLRL